MLRPAARYVANPKVGARSRHAARPARARARLCLPDHPSPPTRPVGERARPQALNSNKSVSRTPYQSVPGSALSRHEYSHSYASDMNAAVTAAISVGGSVIVALAGFLANVRNTNKTTALTLRAVELTEQGQVTDRYTKAVEQLDSHKGPRRSYRRHLCLGAGGPRLPQGPPHGDGGFGCLRPRAFP